MFSPRYTPTHTRTQESRGITKVRRSICCSGMEARKLNARRTQGTNDQGATIEDDASTKGQGNVSGRFLSAAGRLYVYALHGCLCEVAFTAVLDWCSTQDRRLPGHSSMWALPMYATALYFMESLRSWFLAQCCPMPLRVMAYTVFIYLWEFSWGVGLSLLGACPWDYSAYRYNLGGLVTLEYALPWAVAAFIAEQHVIRNTLRIQLHN